MDYTRIYHEYQRIYATLKGGKQNKKEIYTIGHSTHSIKEFLDLLQDNEIKCLVDVRSYPGSRYVPQFNKEYLESKFADKNINYIHIPELGGRRHNKSLEHTSIKSKSFASYAAYMMTPTFAKGLKKLKDIANKCKTAIMCSEVLWFNCHRRMISDRLTFDKWKVYHIGPTNLQLHEIWDIARLNEDNQIIYDK